MSYGHEFSDRLSPFLVKELRQGLRGKVYLAIFLLLTLALALYSISFVGGEPESATRAERGMFNAIVFLAITILLPLNSLGAIGEERRGRKIELVMLTRVKARGVVAGKWLTAAMQSATLASIISPFVVLRYFAGGVDMTEDILFLGFSLFCGLAFTAVTLCASAFLTEAMPVIGGLLRGIILLVSLWAGLMAAFAFGNPFGGMHSEMLPMMLAALASLVIGAPVVLEITAARLAPEAENHDGVIRLLGIAAAMATGATHICMKSGAGLPTVFVMGSGIILTCLLFTVFGAPLEQISYRTPTDRFGAFGKSIGKTFLFPGPHSAFTYAAVTAPATALAVWFSATAKSEQESMTLGLLQFWAAALWPLLPLQLLRLTPHRRFAVWLMLQFAGIILAILAHTQRLVDKSLFDIVPTTALFNLEHNTASSGAFAGTAITFLLVVLAVILGYARRDKRAAEAEFASA